jgi:hypothetical protein
LPFSDPRTLPTRQRFVDLLLDHLEIAPSAYSRIPFETGWLPAYQRSHKIEQFQRGRDRHLASLQNLRQMFASFLKCRIRCQKVHLLSVLAQ